MKTKYISLIGGFVVAAAFGCTKLDQSLNDGFTPNPTGSSNIDITSILNGAYNDMNGLFTSQDLMFSMQETTTDEALIPTRGGDWDDNGVWRVLHAHTWTPLHQQMKNVFIGLGKLESDALATAAQSNNAEVTAEAMFLRSVAQFYFLDLFGQVPYRPVADYNGLSPAPVLQPAAAVDTIATTLRSIIGQNGQSPLSEANWPYGASPDAARFLLMKVLLNKGAFINRETPTFDAADMQEVITLGKAIMASSHGYSLTANFFDNFGVNNGTLSKEKIFAWPNNGTAGTLVAGRTSAGVDARWMMTLHYNSYDEPSIYKNAGWNGFTTVADFYNMFDTADTRIGNRPYAGVTEVSGLRPGFLVGQQYNEAGKPEVDRQGNPLAFTSDVNLVEKDAKRLEVAGIRVVKYPPDYNAYNSGIQRNQLQLFRFADVILMVAEAQMRSGDNASALVLINQVRAARGAAPVVSLPLVNADNVADPNTLLAERGRELYFESWRRQDLIRFGVFLKPWALKNADDGTTNLLYPIAADQLIANPNLSQNPGY